MIYRHVLRGHEMIEWSAWEVPDRLIQRGFPIEKLRGTTSLMDCRFVPNLIEWSHVYDSASKDLVYTWELWEDLTP